MAGISSQGGRLGLAVPPDSAVMGRARRSSSAMAAKYTGWGTALGLCAGDNKAKRSAGARDKRWLINLQRQLSRLSLLIIDELGFVPLSLTRAEFLFEVFSQRYEMSSILVTTNLPFDEWNEVVSSKRLTGALLYRLTHHVHILEMNGDNYRLKRRRENAASRSLGYSEDV